jgi:hypothetical protein
MKDNFNRTIYAEKIANEITDHYESEKKAFLKGEKKERENIVFAISGKWGEGKTSLLGLLVVPLSKKGFKVIRFNPWKYSQEDITLKRAFLRAVRDQIKSLVNLDDLYYDRTKTTLNLDWPFIIRSILVGSFVYFVLIPALWSLPLLDWLNITNNIFSNFLNIPLVKTFLTLLLIPIILQVLTVSRRGANVSTAEEFEQKFEELLKTEEKIVIFIDDLDRCTPKTVKVVLDSLKTFFQHPECSYIITGDHTVIERYAADELELPEGTGLPQKLQEGRRFLKKLFDVYWRLPLPTPYQAGKFVDDEMKQLKVSVTEAQLVNMRAFLLDDSLFERNPRHIKRFITRVRFAMESVILQIEEFKSIPKSNTDTSLLDSTHSLKSILSNPDLLAKTLLIEEFSYPLYEKLILQPAELINHEKSLRSGVNPTELTVGKEKVINI